MYEEDQQHAHDHVVQDGVGRNVDQCAAVVDPLDPDAWRQHAHAVDLVHLGQDAGQGGQRLRAAPHQDDALDDVVVVVLAGDAEPRLIAYRHRRHVGHQYRGAVARRQQRVADIVHRPDLADAAHDGRLRPDVDGVGTDIDIAVVQPVEHLLQGESVGQQAIEIDIDVVGLGLATPAGHVDHAGHRLQAALQDPILDRLEIGHRVARRSDHPVTIDFADRAGRRQCRLGAVGQGLELRQAIRDLLRRRRIGHVVGELHLHVRQAEQGDGADRLDVRQPRHLDLDRDRDVTLDLLGRLAGILRDDVDQRRHRIRIRLDVERLVGEQPADHHHGGENQHENALLERGCYDCMHDVTGGRMSGASYLAALSATVLRGAASGGALQTARSAGLAPGSRFHQPPPSAWNSAAVSA